MKYCYATRDMDGYGRCLWIGHPVKEAGGAWMPKDDARYGGMPLDDDLSSVVVLLHALFPRGMKRGEIRKFKIPRLGE